MKEDRIAILIKRIALSIDKFAGQVLAPYELSNTQYKIIKFLYRQPDTAVRQTDIENEFFLTNPTVTGIIQNLEKKGLVQRIPNPKAGIMAGGFVAHLVHLCGSCGGYRVVLQERGGR